MVGLAMVKDLVHWEDGKFTADHDHHMCVVKVFGFAKALRLSLGGLTREQELCEPNYGVRKLTAITLDGQEGRNQAIKFHIYRTLKSKLDSSSSKRDCEHAMKIATLLADGISVTDLGIHTDETPNMNDIVGQLERKVSEVKGSSYLQEALQDVAREWTNGESSRLEATQRKLVLVTERMKSLQETSQAASSSTGSSDQAVNHATRGTKRAKSRQDPKVNPLRKKPGVDSVRKVITDTVTNEPAEFLVVEFGPCPPPDDDGRRGMNEILLRSACEDLSETEMMVCLAQMDQYDQEEHEGMVPCFRCTRPGKLCEPGVQCDSWNRTRVDQGEKSDHHECSPSLGVGLPLSAQVLQVQFCDRPALFSLCKVCEQVRETPPTVVMYADSTQDLESGRHDSKCVAYLMCDHDGGVLLGKAINFVGAGHARHVVYDDSVPSQYQCAARSRPKSLMVENRIPLGKNPHPWTVDSGPIPLNRYDIRRFCAYCQNFSHNSDGCVMKDRIVEDTEDYLSACEMM